MSGSVPTKTLPSRSTCGQPPKHYEPILSAKAKNLVAKYVSTHRLFKPYVAFVNQLSSVSLPSKVQDAMKDEKWMKAMTIKMDALEKNCTWELVSLPPRKKTVGCRWVHTVKHNPDGSAERYKGRLVAKGYTQKYGVDYDETFAPVAKMNTIQVLLSLAANLDWPL